MNDEARKIAFARPKIIRSIQKYLDNLGYVEVETPILGTILGGAAALLIIMRKILICILELQLNLI